MKRIFFLSVILVSLPALAADSKWTNKLGICDPALKLSYEPLPVKTLNGATMKHQCILENGKHIKLFNISVEQILTKFYEEYEPGPILTWGYRGAGEDSKLDVIAPTIEAVEGETVRFVVTNNLSEPTTIHWHGLELPNRYDGASGHPLPPIEPGETFVYEFELKQNGTFMYHSGHSIAKQLAMGLAGFFIIHPKEKPLIKIDHDILLFLQMWGIPPHSQIPDAMEMMLFNFFTINGKVAPDIEPIFVKPGEKIRIRFANTSMMNHPMHLHGHTFKVISQGPGRIPEAGQTLSNTILIPSGQAAAIEFDATREDSTTQSTWMLHCHLPHHVNNNMEISPVPGEPMAHEMAGMMTVVIIDPEGDTKRKESKKHETKSGDHDHTQGPKMGRYSGTIELTNGKIFTAELELFKVQEKREWRKLRAFLHLYLGGFSGGETITQRYQNIRVNYDTGILTFDEEVRGIALRNMRYIEHGTHMMLSGKIDSTFSAPVSGSIELIHEDAALQQAHTTAQKFHPSLSGEYYGICQEKGKELPSILQIETARGMSSYEEKRPLHLFQGFGITGRLAEKDVRFCKNRDSDNFCVRDSFKGGAYDFFSGNLYLKGFQGDSFNKSRNLNCTVKEAKLRCGICTFEKRTDFLSKPVLRKRHDRQFFLPPSERPKVTQLSSPKDFEGNFFGTLHHELLDKHQHVSLHVRASLSSDNPMRLPNPIFSATATLYFGEPSLGDAIRYDFEARPFFDSSSKHTGNKNSLLLENKEHGISIVIEDWRKDKIQGVWYTDSFGRVGTIELKRTEIPLSLPKEVALIPTISGHFRNALWEFHVRLVPFTDAEYQPYNPSFPLTLQGEMKYRELGFNVPIVFGVYDFMTENLALQVEEFEGERMVTGRVGLKELDLFIPSLSRYGVRLLPHAAESFKQFD